MLNLPLIAQLAAMLSEDNVIEKLARKRLEDAGEGLIMRMLAATPIGAAFEAVSQASEFLDAGEKVLNRAGQRFLNSALPRQPGALRGLESFLEGDAAPPRAGGRMRGRAGQRPQGRRRWSAASRQEWLSNKWRRDWRSQPRNQIGEWVAGRLSHPVTVGSTVSRKQRQVRTRALKGYKSRMAAIGNVRTREINSSWGRF